MSEESRPRRAPLWRRQWLRLTAVGVVGLLAYGLVTSLYDAEGGLTQSGSSAASATSGLVAEVTPVSVGPAVSTAVVRVRFTTADDELLDESSRLGRNTRVTIISADGATERMFGAGTVPAPLEVPIGISGELAQYPFDRYQGVFGILVDSYEVVDGTVRSTGNIPLAVSGVGGVAGWNTSMDLQSQPDELVAVEIGFTRAFSTQAFALLILAAAAALAILGLVVGVLVRTRRRKIEATMLSWGAALLFALPAMRNFMPSSPPIGVAIDIYVFLWVMLAAVSGAVLLILAWIDRDRPRRGESNGA